MKKKTVTHRGCRWAPTNQSIKGVCYPVSKPHITSQEHQEATFARCVSHNPSYSIQTRLLRTVEILQRCTLDTLHKASARNPDLRTLLWIQSDWPTSPSLISNIARQSIVYLTKTTSLTFISLLYAHNQPHALIAESKSPPSAQWAETLKKKSLRTSDLPAAVARLNSHVCLSAHRETRQVFGGNNPIATISC
jgi:hypothetical protein